MKRSCTSPLARGNRKSCSDVFQLCSAQTLEFILIVYVTSEKKNAPCLGSRKRAVRVTIYLFILGKVMIANMQVCRDADVEKSELPKSEELCKDGVSIS